MASENLRSITIITKSNYAIYIHLCIPTVTNNNAQSVELV